MLLVKYFAMCVANADVGSSTYTMDDFRETLAWVASGREDLAPLIEKTVDLDGLPEVFAGYADGSLVAMKTLLRP